MKANMKKKMGKKAQTSVIVTLLLVLVSIGAIVVLALWVFPMIRDNSQVTNLVFELSIDDKNTFFNSNASERESAGQDQSARTYVRVSQAGGAEESELYGIRFIFSFGDDTRTYINTNIPGLAEARTYSFSFATRPDLVKIAPVALISGKKYMLDVLDESKIGNSGKIVFSDGRIVDKCSVLMVSDEDLPPVPEKNNPGCE